MALDPFSSAITALSSAWRPRVAPTVLPVREMGALPSMGAMAPVGAMPAMGAVAPLRGMGTGTFQGFDLARRTTGPGSPWWQANVAPIGGALEAGADAVGGFLGGGSSGGSSGGVGQAPGEFSVLNQYDALFQKAAAQFGIPVNDLKAIAMIERGWEGSGVSPSGAVGIMQVMPQYWGDKGYDIYSTEGNIMAGALAYKSFYDQYADEARARGMDPSVAAARAYLAGNPWSGASDAFGTTTDIYGQRFTDYRSQLGGSAGSAGAGGYAGPVGSVSSIWGGQGDYPVTQEMGLTDFARGNSLYDYARAYNFEGHPGLDIGTPYGTALYTPVGGTVVYGAGQGSGYYANNGYSGPGVGEFRIRLDNGDELILGHMSEITAQAGSRIAAGSYIGKSGTENGDHVHVEYRKSDGNGWFTIADPRQMLGGTGVVTTGGGGGGSTIPAASFGNYPNWWTRYWATGSVY